MSHNIWLISYSSYKMTHIIWVKSIFLTFRLFFCIPVEWPKYWIYSVTCNLHFDQIMTASEWCSINNPTWYGLNLTRSLNWYFRIWWALMGTDSPGCLSSWCPVMIFAITFAVDYRRIFTSTFPAGLTGSSLWFIFHIWDLAPGCLSN